jgi:ketosteroid isomerase-like protein
MVNRQDNERCLQAHLAAEMRHDMTATLNTLHPGCVFADEPLGLRFEGRDGARRHYEMWWAGLDATLDPAGALHWAGDDLVIGDAVFVGHHRGPFAGLAATGRPVRLPFVVFVRFQDGLLAGERFIYDLNGLLRQLGQPAYVPAHQVCGTADPTALIRRGRRRHRVRGASGRRGGAGSG